MAKRSKFRDWLYYNKLTILNVGKIIGCNRSSLTHWMRGDNRPQIHYLEKLRRLTKNEIYYPEDLLDEKAPVEPAPQNRKANEKIIS